eukprot:6337265-Amphidinium_carterae.1
MDQMVQKSVRPMWNSVHSWKSQQQIVTPLWTTPPSMTVWSFLRCWMHRRRVRFVAFRSSMPVMRANCIGRVHRGFSHHPWVFDSLP